MKKVLKIDYRGHLFKYHRRFKLRLRRLKSGFIMKVLMTLKGIKYSKNISFCGLAMFNRYQDSSITIGENCFFVSDSSYNLAGINRKCTISTLKKSSKINIGDRSSFSGTVIGAASRIDIGNDVLCGVNTFISDFDWHNVEPKERAIICESYKPVVIEDNVWLGMNVTVLKGVRIGKNSVIGANSVVTKDIPENVVAAGNPCKVLKKI